MYDGTANTLEEEAPIRERLLSDYMEGVATDVSNKTRNSIKLIRELTAIIFEMEAVLRETGES